MKHKILIHSLTDLLLQETKAWLDKSGTTVDETSQEYIYFLLSKCETLLVSGQVRYSQVLDAQSFTPLRHIDYDNVLTDYSK